MEYFTRNRFFFFFLHFTCIKGHSSISLDNRLFHLLRCLSWRSNNFLVRLLVHYQRYGIGTASFIFFLGSVYGWTLRTFSVILLMQNIIRHNTYQHCHFSLVDCHQTKQVTDLRTCTQRRFYHINPFTTPWKTYCACQRMLRIKGYNRADIKMFRFGI